MKPNELLIKIEHISRIQEDLSVYEDVFIQKIIDETRRIESLTARYLLDELCRSALGITLEKAGFKKNESGCPQFTLQKNAFCSITHSNGWVAVAICGCPIGIDLEFIQEEKANELKAAFSDIEWKQINEDPQLIFLQFSYKEAIAKMKGTGFLTEPNTINTEDYPNKWHDIFMVDKNKKYIFTITTLEHINERDVRKNDDESNG